jgi:hypothetical protein
MQLDVRLAESLVYCNENGGRKSGFHFLFLGNTFHGTVERQWQAVTAGLLSLAS